MNLFTRVFLILFICQGSLAQMSGTEKKEALAAFTDLYENFFTLEDSKKYGQRHLVTVADLSELPEALLSYLAEYGILLGDHNSIINKEAYDLTVERIGFKIPIQEIRHTKSVDPKVFKIRRGKSLIGFIVNRVDLEDTSNNTSFYFHAGGSFHSEGKGKIKVIKQRDRLRAFDILGGNSCAFIL